MMLSVQPAGSSKFGSLALQAAAFVWRERGWAVTGASGAGKTGALLAFMTRGAEFLAADRVRIELPLLHGTHAPIRVRAWHARQLAPVRRALDAPTRWRFDLMGAPQAAFDAIPSAARSRLLAPLVRKLDRRAYVDLDPAQLANTTATQAPFAGVLLLQRSLTRRPRVAVLDPVAAVDALAALVEVEADAAAVEDRREAIARVVAGKRVLRVEHAHGAALAALVDAVLAAID
jgi:hypothetical protein